MCVSVLAYNMDTTLTNRVLNNYIQAHNNNMIPEGPNGEQPIHFLSEVCVFFLALAQPLSFEFVNLSAGVASLVR